jgi:NodT family efflux transporter outer membrane factor (OMF) lipoprotein
MHTDVDVRVHALGILLGQAPAAFRAEIAPMRPLAAAPPIPAGLPSDLLRRRPDIRAAERDLAAASADIGVAVADLYPRFSLTGMAQLISSALGNLFSGDSLQLTGTGAAMFPILDWGTRRATVRIREEDREQAYQRYRSVVLRALRDTEDALTRIDAEQRRHAVLARAIVDAEATARAREAQYRTGFVAQDSLLDAETRVMQAREQLAASEAELRQDSAALFKALGGGWEAAPAGI